MAAGIFGVIGFIIFSHLTAFAVLLGMNLNSPDQLSFGWVLLPALLGCGLLLIVGFALAIRSCVRSNGLGMLQFFAISVIAAPVGVTALLMLLRTQETILVSWVVVFVPVIIAGGIATLISFCICVAGCRSAPKPKHRVTTTGSIQGETEPLLPRSTVVNIYDLDRLKLAALSGGLLKTFVGLLESKLFGRALASITWGMVGLNEMRAIPLDHAPPTIYPEYPVASPTESGSSLEEDIAAISEMLLSNTSATELTRSRSIAQIASALRSNRITAVQLAQTVLKSITDSERHRLAAFSQVNESDVMRQAQDSDERIRKGSARGILEGIPVGVKEELDVTGYKTTLGTSFLRDTASTDATIVSRLRLAGAVIIGMYIRFFIIS